jgi:hypothetical protein
MNQIINLNDQRSTNPASVFPMGEDIGFPVGTRPIAMMGANGRTAPVESHKAVIRMGDNGEPICLGIVGEKYEVVPHADHFGLVEESLLKSIKSASLEGCYTHDKISAHGAWVRRDYIFPAVTATIETPGVSSKLGYGCFAWNSYDGSSSVAAMLGALDFYCTNGQFSMDYDAKSFRRHTSGLNLEDFRVLLENGVHNFYSDAEKYQDMVRTNVSDDKVEEFFLKKFSPQRVKRLMIQYHEEVAARGQNVWAVWSTLTAFSSHASDLFTIRNTGNDNAQRTLNNRQGEVHKIMQSQLWNDFQQAAA